jgi:CrcB protein
MHPAPLHWYLLVALGSALGGAGRLWLSTIAGRTLGTQFPWGTLLVNLLGCLLVGVLAALLAPDAPLHEPPEWRVFLVVGVLGGFTTFSAFSLDALLLVQHGQWLQAAAYVTGSVLLSLALTAGAWYATSGLLR